MNRSCLNGAVLGVALLSSLSAAAQNAPGDQPSQRAPRPTSIAPAPPGAEREAIPGFLFRGQLRLTAEQRRQIWQSIGQINADQQPVPRAFAAAVGQTAPRELNLASLPPKLLDIPGVEKHHQFAVLDTDVILIVGEDRLVVAMIQSDERQGDSRTSTPPSNLLRTR